MQQPPPPAFAQAPAFGQPQAFGGQPQRQQPLPGGAGPQPLGGLRPLSQPFGTPVAASLPQAFAAAPLPASLSARLPAPGPALSAAPQQPAPLSARPLAPLPAQPGQLLQAPQVPQAPQLQRQAAPVPAPVPGPGQGGPSLSGAPSFSSLTASASSGSLGGLGGVRSAAPALAPTAASMFGGAGPHGGSAAAPVFAPPAPTLALPRSAAFAMPPAPGAASSVTPASLGVGHGLSIASRPAAPLLAGQGPTGLAPIAGPAPVLRPPLASHPQLQQQQQQQAPASSAHNSASAAAAASAPPFAFPQAQPHVQPQSQSFGAPNGVPAPLSSTSVQAHAYAQQQQAPPQQQLQQQQAQQQQYQAQQQQQQQQQAQQQQPAQQQQAHRPGPPTQVSNGLPPPQPMAGFLGGPLQPPQQMQMPPTPQQQQQVQQRTPQASVPTAGFGRPVAAAPPAPPQQQAQLPQQPQRGPAFGPPASASGPDVGPPPSSFAAPGTGQGATGAMGAGGPPMGPSQSGPPQQGPPLQQQQQPPQQQQQHGQGGPPQMGPGPGQSQGPPMGSGIVMGPPRASGPPTMGQGMGMGGSMGMGMAMGVGGAMGSGPPQQHSSPPQSAGPPMGMGGPPMGPGSGPGQMGPPPPMQGLGPGQGPPPLASPPKSIGSASSGGSGSAGLSAPAAPAPRIDPTQIPRPRYTSPAFPVRYNTTDHLVNTPPFAWSDFVAEDTGNANPRFLRCTLGHVPVSKEVLKETKLPLAVVVTPLAHLPPTERQPLVVDFGEEGPPRCGRCRGYVSVFSKWSAGDGGRTWACSLCGMANETPAWYACPNGVDQYGERRDKGERPELCFGSVEFVAPASYLVDLRAPSPLCVAFLLDVSLLAVTSGLLGAAAAAVREALGALEASAAGSRVRAGVVAFDSQLHFFDCSGSARGRGDRDVTTACVGDIDDAFCPLSLAQWCPPIAEAHPQLDQLLARLPTLFPPTQARPTQSASGAALKAAIDGLGDTGGRVVLFMAQLPLVGEGKLGSREVAKSYGTDKEREMYSCAGGDAGRWYTDLARHAASRGVSVDVHACPAPGAYLDLPTHATLVARTGGEMLAYPFFAPPQGQGSAPTAQAPAPVAAVSPDALQRVAHELCAKMARETGTEAVLKVRTSPGLRTHKYVGNFEERAENEADLAVVDSEKAVLVTLQHDGTEVKTGDDLYVQAALLYTTAAGQRRVRVHNLRLIAADAVQSVFRHADVDAIMAHLLRASVQTTLTKEPKFVAEDLQEASIDMLLAYRRHCATNSSQGQLILPESLKLLPLYLSTVLKLGAFTINRPVKFSAPKAPFAEVGVRVDARIAELVSLSSMQPARIVPFLYPRIFRVDNMAAQHGVPVPPQPATAALQPLQQMVSQSPQAAEAEAPPLPAPRPATELSEEDLRLVALPPSVYPSYEQLNANPAACFLIDHRSGLFLVVGAATDEEAFTQLFGGAAPTPQQLPPGSPLIMYDSDLSMRLWAVIYALRARRTGAFMPVQVIAPGDRDGLELVRTLMVEDSGKLGGKSYVDLLCHVHTQIQQRLQPT